jgi:diguanylate cyclase (GGDEF)-like protein
MAKQILIVDDDAVARILLKSALGQAGYQIGMAEDGAHALREFEQQRWDLVMLDVGMPGLSGYEVCVAMRRSVGELLPIVMVTGMDDVASIEKAYESGATDFIAKPLNPALIVHRVKYLLRAHQSMLDLRAADARNAAMLQAIPDALFELDLEGRCLAYHAPRTNLYAAPPHVYLGKTVHAVLPPEAAAVCLAALGAAAQDGFSNGQQMELDLPRGKAWFELSISRKPGGPGEAPTFIVLSRDITQRKQYEQQILRLAHVDSLTGLPNRQSFLNRVEREVARAYHQGQQLALLFVDLDGFKQVNDVLGHAAGDEVLQAVAERLRDAIRPSDLVSRFTETHAEVELARLGGDEFTALLLDIDGAEDALAVARRIRDIVARPIVVQGRLVAVGTSIGIAVYPDDAAAAAGLLECADTAMYRAKALGGSACELYGHPVEPKVVDLLASTTGFD